MLYQFSQIYLLSLVKVCAGIVVSLKRLVKPIQDGFI